jgi:hypothetical protein
MHALLKIVREVYINEQSRKVQRGIAVQNNIYNVGSQKACLCGLVVRVLDCRTEMYSASCEARTEFIYVM